MSLLLALVLTWIPHSLQDSSPSLGTGTGLEKLSMDALLEKLPPVGEEWIGPGLARVLHPASEEFTNRLQAGTRLSAEQCRRALLDTGVLRVRERWPAGVPFAVSIRVPAWLPANTVLILDPSAESGLRGACAGTFSSGGCAMPGIRERQAQAYQELGKLPAGRREVRFHLEILRADSSTSAAALRTWLSTYLENGPGFELGLVRLASGLTSLPKVVSTGELTVAIEVVPTFDDVLPAVSTPELDDAVRRSLTLEAAGDATGKPVLWSDWKEEQTSIGLSLEVEVRENGELRERTHLVTNEKNRRNEPRGTRGVYLESLETVLRDPAAHPTWRIHLRGTKAELLHSWSIDRRWSGELELTLDELLERGSTGD